MKKTQIPHLIYRQFFRRMLLMVTFAFVITVPLSAQEVYVINGRVINQSNHPLDYASVTLLHASDSSFIRSTFSDEQGNYHISAPQKGSYIIVASLVGYTKSYQYAQLSESQKQVLLSDLILTPASNRLQEVTVTAQTPVVERRDGALVVQVANSSLSAGNTAMDILQRSPGVSVDKDGNISLMGRQGVTVMIDGKQTYLSAEQLANMLKSMDGNNVQSIELNTNPSAKYDAAGTAGIINIRLKKNQLEGTHGTVSLSAGYGRTHKSNQSIQLNHKVGKFNLFGNYAYMNNGNQETLLLYRTVGQDPLPKIFDQKAEMNDRKSSSNIRTGVDFQSSERNTLSLLFSGLFLNQHSHSNSLNDISNLHGPIDSILHTINRGESPYRSLSLNLNNTFNIDTNGRKLTFEGDISRFKDRTENSYDNFFLSPQGDDIRDPEFILNTMPSDIHIQTIKMDYTHPFDTVHKIETGLKYSRVKSDNNLGFYRQVSGDWQNDEQRTNHFIYTEKVIAGYAIYQQTIHHTEIKTGLRVEHTYSDGNLVTLSQRNTRNYTSFFPNVHIQQTLSDKHSLAVSYSRRINRPNYSNLNPFVYYVDPYSYQQGNPYLNPSYTDSYELSYTWMKKYTLTSGYQQTKDMVGEIMYQNDETNAIYVTRENIAREKVYFVNLNIPLSAGKVWSSNTNINALHLAYVSDHPQAPIDYGQYALQINTNHTVNLTSDTRFEATWQYQSPLRWSIYQIGASWELDLGVNKSFLDKKLQLKLAVSDVFYKKPNLVKTDYANLNVRVLNKWESRVARLTLTYNFGNQKLKTSERSLDSIEKSRIGK